MRTRRAVLAVASTLAVALGTGCTGSPGSSEPTEPGTTITRPPPFTASVSPPPSVHVGEPQLIATGLNVPWGIAFLPNGDALVSERDTHRIRRVTANGTITTVGTVSGVSDDTAEGGLLGIALSPTFKRDHLVYAYTTAQSDNRVVRFTFDGDRITDQHTVFSGIPRAAIHDGGRIKFGSDHMLYVTTGDATQSDRAQDRSYLGGKVLRMTPAGKPAPGNPFDGSVVWTLGHRNPQGLAWGPGKHPAQYEAEFGQSSLDEINLLRPGRNYGWPTVEGTIGPTEPKFTPPLLTWRTSEASPSGLAYAKGSLWLATLQGENVYRIPVVGGRNAAKVGKPTSLLAHKYGRLRTITVAPDGSLWVTTSNRDGRGSPTSTDDRIIRIPLSGS